MRRRVVDCLCWVYYQGYIFHCAAGAGEHIDNRTQNTAFPSLVVVALSWMKTTTTTKTTTKVIVGTCVLPVTVTAREELRTPE